METNYYDYWSANPRAPYPLRVKLYNSSAKKVSEMEDWEKISNGISPDPFSEQNIKGLVDAMNATDFDTLPLLYGSPDNSASSVTDDLSDPGSVSAHDYPYAPYATLYGMSSDTAYQEALANTSHQREVADLKAAGLNPVLGVSGSGASVVSGSASSGVSSSASRSPLIDIVGDLLTLGTRRASIGNAAKSLGHTLENILT